LNKIKQIAGQTAIYGISSIVSRLLNYLLTPLHVSVFAPSQYGVITEMYAYVSFLIVFLTYGMETAYFRYSHKYEHHKVYSTAITSLSISSSLFLFFVLLFSNNIAAFIGYPNHPEYVKWFALVVAIDAFNTIPFAKLRNQNKAVKFSVIRTTNILVNIIMNILFLVVFPHLYHKPGFAWLSTIYNPSVGVGYVFIANLIASIVTFFMLLPVIFEDKIKFDGRLWKEMIIYALPLLIGGLAGMVNETLDRILLKVYLPPEVNPLAQIGIYGANYKVAILMTLFIQMFRYAAEPFFFANAKEKNSKQLYADVMKYFIIFGLSIFLFVMLYIDVIKAIIINERYYEGIKVVPVLLLANLFLGIFYNLSVWYKINNLTKFGAYLQIFGATITILLNIYLIPRIGYMGAAWATFFCYFSTMTASYFLSRRYYAINYDLKSIGLYFLVAIGLYVIVSFINYPNNIVKYTINTILFLGFVSFASYREKLLPLLFKKSDK
jgi:O-antigen/teichoic acid export membrane protein